MSRLQRFDVFRAGIIGGTPLGQYIATIEAPDHATAKNAVEDMYGAAYVVLPAGRGPVPTAPVTIRDDRRARSTPHRPRP